MLKKWTDLQSSLTRRNKREETINESSENGYVFKLCEGEWLRCIYMEEIDLKKLIVILGIGIIASCVKLVSLDGILGSYFLNKTNNFQLESLDNLHLI